MILPPLKHSKKQSNHDFSDISNYSSKIINPLNLYHKILHKNQGFSLFSNKITHQEQCFNEQVLQKKVFMGYKGYSKSKNNSLTKKNNDYLGFQHNTVLIPEYSVTPGILYMMNAKNAEKIQKTYKFKKIIEKNAKIQANSFRKNYHVLTNIEDDGKKRKVVLSKTPDPWKKHINKGLKAFHEDSEESADEIVDNLY